MKKYDKLQFTRDLAATTTEEDVKSAYARHFYIGNNDYRKKKILSKDYEHFWSLYERISSPDVLRGILNKLDRLTDDALRRFHGEFFTPLTFARKGLEYLEKTLGQHWWQGNYRLWDMAAGTGNLEWYIPTDAWGKVYLSSLYNEEVEHCRRLFPDATSFQYDYLNDDIDYLFSPATLPFGMHWKLPERLRADLADPAITWIILINPPFATSQTAAMKNVAYKGSVYQIHNHLFPYPVAAVKRWKISDADIALSLASAEDSFATTWLRGQTLTAEARVVMAIGEEIYRCYFENLANLRTPKYRIETWDAGWWQIRNALVDQNLAEKLFVRMKQVHGAMKDKLLPQVYELGFL